MNFKILMLAFLSVTILPTFSMHDNSKKPNNNQPARPYVPFPWGNVEVDKKALEEELDDLLAPTLYDNPHYGDEEIGLMQALLNKSHLEEKEQESVNAAVQEYVTNNKDSNDEVKRVNAARLEFLSKTN